MSHDEWGETLPTERYDEWGDHTSPEERTELQQFQEYAALATEDSIRRHAHNQNSPFHAEARERLKALEASDEFKNRERLYSISDDEFLREYEAKMEPIRTARSEEQAARNAQIFMRDEDSYVATPNNAALMDAFLRSHRMKPTVENLRQAWNSVRHTAFAESNPEPLPKSINKTSWDKWPQRLAQYTAGDEDLL